LKQRAPKSGSNESDILGPISGRGLPFFDLMEYELDPESPWETVNAAIVWNLRRKFEFPDCPKRCGFAECPNRNQLERGSIRAATFTYVPEGVTPQKIRIHIQRWFWKGDPAVEVEPALPHPGISAEHRMTIAAIEFAETELKAGVPPKSIAQKLGVVRSTVYLLKSKFVSKSRTAAEGASAAFILCLDPEAECLQFDDVQLGDVYYTLILELSPKKSFVGLVPGRSGEAVIPALTAIFALCRISRATTDFGDYVPILKTVKPDLMITGDKWHFTERLKKVLAEIAKAAAADLAPEKADLIRERLIASAMRIADRVVRKERVKRIAASGIADLFEENIDLFRTTYRNLSGEKQAELAFWLRQIPAIKEPHKLLQRMYWLFNQRHLSVTAARQRFWKAVYLFQQNAPEAYELAAFMFEERYQEILAYFDTRETNARAESLIHQIRIMLSVSGGLGYGELVRRLIQKYGNGSPQHYFSAKWEPLGTASGPTIVACRGEDSRSPDSRQGKHAPRKHPLEPTPPGMPSQGTLNLE